MSSDQTATLSERQLNRATLARQLLLRRQRLGAAEAVRRVVALQAQEAASPYIALWNRVAGFDPAELDAAFADYSVVKASLMRVTLHAVHADDYAPFHEAMQRTLRAARLNDSRFRLAGLAVDEVEALLPELLSFAAQPRTNAQFEAWLDERLGVLPRPGVWWGVRQVGSFVHAPTGGPWSFGPRPSYLAAPRQQRSGDADASLGVLIRRYLEGFGPATLADIGQFGLLNRSWARPVLDSMADQLVRRPGPGRAALYDVPDGVVPDEDEPAPPRLLPMWDSILLAYADRTRVVPAEYRKLVTRNNGDTLPTLLVDGYVRGVWRAVEGGIEATAFERLPREAWAGLESEARSLVRLLADRDPRVYRRYARWWDSLPAKEVRVIGG